LNPRLNVFNDLLLVPTGEQELDVARVLVDIITQHLLALLVNRLDVVDDNHLLAADRPCLAKRLHLVAEIRDALLLLQIVDKQDIVLATPIMGSKSIRFPDQCIQERRFPRRRLPHKEYVGLEVQQQLFNDLFFRRVEIEIVYIVRFVFLNKRLHEANQPNPFMLVP